MSIKKFLTVLIISLLTFNVIAQDENNSNNIWRKDGRMGIGIKWPEYMLDIRGEANGYGELPRQFLNLHNTDNSGHSNVAIRLASGTEENEALGSLGVTANSYVGAHSLQGYTYLFSKHAGIAIRAVNPAGNVKFITGGNNQEHERMRIDAQGNVGIGTNEALARLDVNGGLKVGFSDKKVEGLIRWNGEDFEGFSGNSWKSFTSGSSGQSNSLNRIGIGIDPPEYLLDIRGDAGAYDNTPRQFIYLHNTNNSAHSNVAVSMRSGSGENEVAGSFGVTAYSYQGAEDLKGFTYIYSKKTGIALRSVAPDGIIKFLTGGNDIIHERMRIDAEGDIGIGTKEPISRLHVTDGDILIEDIERGIIMRSPDGKFWRGTLDNSGNLIFNKVDMSEGKKSVPFSNASSYDDIASVYPNPVSEKMNLKISDDEVAYYSIYDLFGIEYESGRINSEYSSFDLSNYKQGAYVIELRDSFNNTMSTRQFIKK